DVQRMLYRLGPSTAGLTVQTTVDLARLPIGPWAGLGVTALWAFGAAAAGAAVIYRQDVP
ncbi:MAG TPA: ABC transporter permease, partial [Actinoplanes sp.]